MKRLDRHFGGNSNQAYSSLTATHIQCNPTNNFFPINPNPGRPDTAKTVSPFATLAVTPFNGGALAATAAKAADTLGSAAGPLTSSTISAWSRRYV